MKEFRLGTSSMEYSEIKAKKTFTIKEVLKENSGIYILGNLDKKEMKFRVAYFTEDAFYLYYKDKSDANYQYEVRF